MDFPEKKQKTKIGLEIDAALLERVKAEAKKRNLKLREVFEFGLKKFLQETEK